MGTLRRVRPIDIDTGEIVEEMPIVVTRKYRNAFTGGWLTMSQDVTMTIAMAKDLTLYDYKVLMALLGMLDMSNWIQVNQSRLAERINVPQPNVSRSINKLIDLGLIKRGPRVGNTWSYRLNPDFVYKGKVKDHRKVIEDWQKMPKMPQKEVDDGSTPDHE